VAWWLGRWTRD